MQCFARVRDEKGSEMDLVELGGLGVTYTSLESLDYGSDGQLCGR